MTKQARTVVQGDEAGAKTPHRLRSVDSLRGLTVAAMLLVNTPGDWAHVYPPLRHAVWNGVTPTDVIFPLFLFIVGVSVALAPSSGSGARAGWTPILSRAARIVLLGLALHGLAFVLLEPTTGFRLWGVLQRIGFCYAAAGLLALYDGARIQWLVIAGLLVGYAALMAPWGYEPFLNLASRTDALLFGPLLYQYDPATGLGHDPEGLLSTLPAIATTLIGVRAGVWLRQGRTPVLLAAGAGLIALGVAASLIAPLNKNLWTSSYAVFTAGWAMFGLAAAHVLIDRRRWPDLGRAFGRNAIVAYAGSAAMVYLLIAAGVWDDLYRVGFGWMTPLSGPYLPSLLFAAAFTAVWAVIVKVMDRRGWRVRI
jgi:predicted acyltransferase